MFRIQYEVPSFSDSGVGLHEEEEATVNKLINQLEAVGKQQVRAAVPAAPASFDAQVIRCYVMQEPRALDNPLIFGNFGVAFSSTQQAPKQSGQRESHLTHGCFAN